MLFFIITIFAVLIATVFLIFKFVPDAKKLWGINLNRVHCPKCGKAMPYVRKPASQREALWGGWTCQNCGTEMDKWGKDISQQSPALSNSLSNDFADPIDEKGRSPVERIFQEKESNSDK